MLHTALPSSSAPTRHPPGTRDKVEVMCERARLGLPLFHPHDATDDDYRKCFRRPVYAREITVVSWVFVDEVAYREVQEVMRKIGDATLAS